MGMSAARPPEGARPVEQADPGQDYPLLATQEIRYRSPRRVPGQRAGSHAATALGAGLEFVTHQSLYARPDPRRLDLRASLVRQPPEWLVRVPRQRAALAVHLLVDVSASMRFGAPAKLEVVARFAEALGASAFRVGDALGMVAFDAGERADLRVPPARHRGLGGLLATLLRQSAGGAGGFEGLREATTLLAGRSGIVFLASDFHWSLAGLDDVLQSLLPAHVVPLVVWDPAETDPPGRDGLLVLRDAESRANRTLWLRPALRSRWREAVRERRVELERLFGAHDLRPFWLQGGFDAGALSQHLGEETA
jgi:hypothetical protein